MEDNVFTKLDFFVKLIDNYEERLDIIKYEAEFITAKELTQNIVVVLDEYKDRVNGFVEFFIRDGGDKQGILNAVYENFNHITDISVKEVLVRACVNADVDFDVELEDGETILLKSVIEDNVDLTKFLIKYGASPNITIQYEGEKYKIFEVIDGESSDIVRKRFEENLKYENLQKKLLQ